MFSLYWPLMTFEQGGLFIVRAKARDLSLHGLHHPKSRLLTLVLQQNRGTARAPVLPRVSPEGMR